MTQPAVVAIDRMVTAMLPGARLWQCDDTPTLPGHTAEVYLRNTARLVVCFDSRAGDPLADTTCLGLWVSRKRRLSATRTASGRSLMALHTCHLHICTTKAGGIAIQQIYSDLVISGEEQRKWVEPRMAADFAAFDRVQVLAYLRAPRSRWPALPNTSCAAAPRRSKTILCLKG